MIHQGRTWNKPNGHKASLLASHWRGRLGSGSREPHAVLWSGHRGWLPVDGAWAGHLWPSPCCRAARPGDCPVCLCTPAGPCWPLSSRHWLFPAR